jgi:ribosomal protein S16
VVFGGASHAKRDARMRELIARYVPMAVTGRAQIYVRKPRFEQEVQPGDANIGNM